MNFRFFMTPLPSLEQRVTYLEAMLQNTDPSATGIAPVAAPWHTVWMMVSAILVLFMMMPGLALFYGGLVRQKNVLSILATCLGIGGLVTILWWAVGYSLVFGRNFHSPFLGGSEYFFCEASPKPQIQPMRHGFLKMFFASTS